VKKIFSLVLASGFLINSVSAQATTSPEFTAQEEKVPGTPIVIKMAAIPAGSFEMGSNEKEPGFKPGEGPKKKVELSAFWMGVYEVTHDDFLVFFNDETTSRNSTVDAVTRPTTQYIDLSWGMGKQGGFPFNSMSQHTALMYCQWLYKKTGSFYRLPTEAEWEYACRAGSGTAYYFGDDASQLPEYAWFAANSSNKYQKVGQKKPNAWGLYDMLGNVAEWTLDQYDSAYFTTIGDAPVDPVIKPVTRYPRSVRGGGYSDKPEMLRCGSRFHSDVTWNKRDPQVPKSKWWLTDAMSVGFRVVKPLKQPTAEEAAAYYALFLSK
jgi:formylglycine-generating enzyme required for sulfatase activity